MTITPPKVPGSEGGNEAIPLVELALVLRTSCDKYGGIRNELPLTTNDLLIVETKICKMEGKMSQDGLFLFHKSKNRVKFIQGFFYA